ncbi:ABC transporter ATP-binding protein [Nocardiopsis potens]|uniref:ABC transporter ATP-binding protein n=1 Tax=Nocardiopsis potens TaxID=1246458 RepID=UPI0030846E87
MRRETAGPSVPGRSDLGELWRHLRPHWRTMLAGGALGLVGNAVALAQPMAAKQVIEAVGGGGIAPGPVATLAVLVVLGGILAAGGAYLLERMAARVVRRVRGQMARHLVRLRLEAVDRPGDLISRVTADTTLLSRVATRAVVDSANALLMIMGAVVLMGVLDVVLLGITVLVFSVILGVAATAMPRIARAQEKVQRSVGDIGAGLERMLGAFRTMKASGTEAAESGRIDRAAERAMNDAVTTAKWTAVARVAAGLATQTAFLAVLGVGGARVAAGDLEVSSLIAFLLYLFNMAQPLGALVQGVTELQGGLAAVRRIREVEDLPVEQPSSEGAGAQRLRPEGPASGAFEEVRFGYGAEPVLDGVSFEFQAGSVVALVGESGGGKTTAFSLLERFYDPEGGAVRLDGVDLREWPLGRLRAQIGYVEQDAPMLQGTLRENLLYSAPEAGDDELRIVLEKTRLAETVAALPQGVETPVGHRGANLSGGQKQRIAIARALLRRPRLLLLDEATSQLDAANEKALRETIAEVAGETTVLLIAHRLSTVVDADEVIVFEGGRIRARGTHGELLAGDELYRRFAGSQVMA